MEYYDDIYEGRHRVEGKKGNTHPYYIREFTNIYYKDFNKEDSRILRTNMKELKQFREDSDYKNEEILESKVDKAEKMMNEFHRITKKHMGI